MDFSIESKLHAHLKRSVTRLRARDESLWYSCAPEALLVRTSRSLSQRCSIGSSPRVRIFFGLCARSPRRYLTSMLILSVLFVLSGCPHIPVEQSPIPFVTCADTESSDKSIVEPANAALQVEGRVRFSDKTKIICRVGRQGGRLSFKEVSLVIPADALKKPADIEIHRVADEDMPILSPGMINVTKGGGAFRFLPADIQFNKSVQVSIPLTDDPKLAPIWTAYGAQTYFWDEETRRWKLLSRISIASSHRQIVSQSKHFTFMINATLKGPEQPGPANFNPNSIKDLAAVDPTENLDLIDAPGANNIGDARVSFPIRLPAGRGAYSPSLQLSYSSAQTNGPLGIGWTLPISRVEIDTRWGVPLYDGSERFLLGEDALVPVSTDPYSRCMKGSIERQYAARIQAFRRIVLCNEEGTRHWEVTNKDGTRFEYGNDTESRLSSYRSGEDTHIGAWLLRRVVDTNQNVTEYRYYTDSSDVITDFRGEPFVQKYLSRIEYTSHPHLPAAYRADVQWSCADRIDSTVSGRLGFKVLTRCLLDKINVDVKDEQQAEEWNRIRSYDFKYKQGHFFKTLLSEVKVHGAEGGLFYKHSFDYTAPEYLERATGDRPPMPFADTVIWPLDVPDPRPLQKRKRRLEYTEEENHEVGGGVGVALEVGIGESLSAGCEAGVSGAVSLEFPEPKQKLRDINGDGIVDRIWVRHGDVRIALGQITNEEQGFFGVGGGRAESRDHVEGLTGIGTESSLEGTVGVGASCSATALVVTAEVSGGVNFSGRMTGAGSLLVDVDGDGYIDLLEGGLFYPQIPKICRDGTIPPPGGASNPDYGTCADGLRVCLVRDVLCFGPAEDLSAYRPSAPAGLSTLRTPLGQYANVPNSTPNASIDSQGKWTSIHRDHHINEDSEGIPNRRVLGFGTTQLADASAVQEILSDLPTPGYLEGLTGARQQSSAKLVLAQSSGDTSSSTSNSPELFPINFQSTLRENEETNLKAQEDTWGFFTSATRRLKKESNLQGEFYKQNPVIRWDAAHTGSVRVNVRVRKKHKGGKDGVRVYALRVTDFQRASGTTLLHAAAIEPNEENWVSVVNNETFSVSFGESLLVTIDSLNDVPVSIDGTLLDEVDVDIDISYETVCRPTQSCRQVLANELTHRGPTGQLEYLFRFPEDFSTAELPRESFWKLMPPLGPSRHGENGERVRNRVIGQVRKLHTTPTPVHVRVRCESVVSRHAQDGTTCPLGTILKEHVFAAEEVGEATIEVDLPEPFITYRPPPASGLPDLSIAHINRSIQAPTTADVVKYEVLIQNIGAGRSSATELEFRWGGETYGQIFSIPALDPGQGYRVIREGRHRIAQSYRHNIKIDVDNKVVEADETNNIFSDRVTVKPHKPYLGFADLAVSQIRRSHPVPKTTDLVTYTAQIQNIGSVSSPKSTLEFRVGGETRGQQFDIPPLVPGQQYSVERQARMEVGNRYIHKIRLDVAHDVPEQLRENNNELWHYVTVHEPFASVATSDRVFDPIRLLFEIDGENGVEISPDSIEWNPILEIASIRDVVTKVDAYGDKVVLESDTLENFNAGDLPTYEAAVLHRVHPARELIPFTTREANSRLHIKATAVHPKHKLLVSVSGDHIENQLGQLTIFPELAENQADCAVGGSAVTCYRTIILPSPGTYYIRGYTEASFDISTSYRVEATLETVNQTGFYALIHNQADQPPRLPGPPPVPLDPLTSYVQLDDTNVTIAVIENSEAEAIATQLAPTAQKLVIPPIGPGQTYNLAPGYSVLGASATDVEITFPDGHVEIKPYEQIPRVAVRHGVVDATLIKGIELSGIVYPPPAWEPGAYSCCPPWFAETWAPPWCDDPWPGVGGTLGCPPYAVTFIERKQVPVNLLTADFGWGYELKRLVGEVAHSLETYGGGHHGFFYGVFNGNKPLECIQPFPCKEEKGAVEKSAIEKLAIAPLPISLSTTDIVVPPDEQPECTDVDGDGVCPDSVDACPTVPEDFDGYQDGDGCPDPETGNDLDDDQVADSDDPYPYAPEDFDNNSDEDGIPDDPTDMTVADYCPEDGTIDLSSTGCEGEIIRRHSPLGDEGSENCMTAGAIGAYICTDGTHASERGSTAVTAPIELNPIRRAWTFGTSAHLGASVSVSPFESVDVGIGVGVGVNTGASTSYVDRDVKDWNGDGVIDFLSPDMVTLGAHRYSIFFDTDCYLGLGNNCWIYPGLQESVNTTFGLQLSGSGRGAYVHKTDSEGDIKYQGRANATFGRGAQASHSSTYSTRVDINGDGLPDLVFAGGDPEAAGDAGISGDTHMWVRLNLGYRFGELEELSQHQFHVPSVEDGFGGVIAPWLSDRARLGAMTESDNLTLSKSVGGGGGLSVGIFGGGGSFSKTQSSTVSQASSALIDINGDGLIDLVQKSPDSKQMIVRANTGMVPTSLLPGSASIVNSWISPPDIPRFDWISNQLAVLGGLDDIVDSPYGPDGVSSSGSGVTNWSGSAYAIVFFVKVRTNYSYTEGNSRLQLAFIDMDGDGLPDRVLRSGNESAGSVQVQRNRLGGANLLKTIHRPLGGKVELSYKRHAPTEEDPYSRWLLEEVSNENEDFVPESLRFPTVTATYEYEDPYYDRYERQNLGFQVVKTTRGDGRITERGYYNRDVGRKGLLHFERVYDSEGALTTELERTYTVETVTPDSFPERETCIRAMSLPLRRLANAHPTPCDAVFTKPTSVVTRYYEGGEVAQILRHSFDEYDRFGNLMKLKQEHGYQGLDANGNIVAVFNSEPQDVLVTTIAYDNEQPSQDSPSPHVAAFLNAHIVDRITSIEMREGGYDGPYLRIRKGQYDDAGNLTQHEVWADENGTNIARLTVEYTEPEAPDSCLPGVNTGFITAIEDANGYRTEYTPDCFVNLYAEKTKDSFNLQSTHVYDFSLQTPKATTDANNNLQEWDYDEFGRLSKVWSPYETRVSGIPSLSVQYSALNEIYPTYSITTNAALKPGTSSISTKLRIGRFVDGLGREIQSQSDAEVSGIAGRVISGKVQFDKVGHVKLMGEPVFAANPADTNPAPMTFVFLPDDFSSDSARKTEWEYDQLDRPTKQIRPGDVVTNTEYGISEHPRRPGFYTRTTEIVDTENKTKVLHYDAIDRLVAVVERIGDVGLVTSYTYKPSGEIVGIRDAAQVTRSFEYDLVGRRTAMTSPDTGRSEYAYDAMGNLVAWTDQEICNDPVPMILNCNVDEKVVRIYRKNRLITIDYPVSADVTYIYGDEATIEQCDLAGNIKGRVCNITDGAGEEVRSYGALGEAVSVTRTMIAEPWSTTKRSFQIGYEYDSFGRLLTMRYPDGETLTYEYDGGGRAKSLNGSHAGASKVYLSDIQYDKYGKLSRIEYGNGVVTTNLYEPDTQLIETQTITEPTAPNPLRAIDYTYDKAGNVRFWNERQGELNSGITSISREYTYDDRHQLDTFTLEAALESPEQSFEIRGDYDYDEVGNIERQHYNFVSGGANMSSFPTRDWLYDYSNIATPNLPQTIGPYSIRYDSRGSVTAVTAPLGIDAPPGAAYTWNDQGRLSQSEVDGVQSVTTYAYNYGGGRMRKETRFSGMDVSQSSKAVVYPTPFYTAEFRRSPVVGCITEPCYSEASSRTKHIYLNGLQIASDVSIVGVDSLNNNESALDYLSSSAHFLHTNLVHSTMLVTDENGYGSHQYEYLPFGEIVGQLGDEPDGGSDSFVAFNGKEFDLDNYLYFFGKRYYHPLAGRWLSADPLDQLTLEKSLKLPIAQNFFTFGLNNPISFRDPDGAAPSSEIFEAAMEGYTIGLFNGVFMLFEAVFNARSTYDNPMARVEFRPEAGIYSDDPDVDAAFRSQVEMGKVVGTIALIYAARPRDQAARMQLSRVNKGPGPRTRNCVNCFVATEAALQGRAATALPSNAGVPLVRFITEMRARFGAAFRPMSRETIATELLAAGEGSRGAVWVWYAGGRAHVFNAVNQRGAVRFLDGQSGKAATWEGVERVYFMRTN
ncbi:MAG: hypothetical protein DBO99_05960 [gamma proteobacterium symbiont of Ctena orbiculata]|nr:MAG: hypothetical protein DBO99_05960 [gamma proteobacterium symbiont of Ctena orbiculata]